MKIAEEKASMVQTEETNPYLGKPDLSYAFLKDEEETILAYPADDPSIIVFYHQRVCHKWDRLGTYNLRTKEYQKDPHYLEGDWYYPCVQRHIAYLEEIIKRAAEE